jgi:hypothetical protein
LTNSGNPAQEQKERDEAARRVAELGKALAASEASTDAERKQRLESEKNHREDTHRIQAQLLEAHRIELPLVSTIASSIGAVVGTESNRLPSGYMLDEEDRLLAFMRDHARREVPKELSGAMELCVGFLGACNAFREAGLTVGCKVAADPEPSSWHETIEQRDAVRIQFMKKAQSLVTACPDVLAGWVEERLAGGASTERISELGSLLETLLESGSAEREEAQDLLSALERHDKWVDSQSDQAKAMCDAIR